MPKYEVFVKRDVRYEVILEVEAESEEAAFKWVEESVNSGDEYDWQEDFTDHFIQVFESRETDASPLYSAFAADPPDADAMLTALLRAGASQG